MKIHFREQYGSTGEEVLYVTPDNQDAVVRVNVKGEKPKLRKRLSLRRFFQNLFLPAGYPDSVSGDYLAYQKWDTVQAFCSTISGTLTTHAILKGVGVGSDVANPLSATITWVLKDGMGHFGRIIFAWWKGVLYGLFLFVTLLHIYANIKAVKSVCLRTFNEARYLIALEEYFKSGTMLSPEQVNKLERVTIGQTVTLTARVKIGCSARELAQYYRVCYDLENLMACFDSRDKFIIAETRNYVGVYLHFTAKPLDIIKAYFYVASYLQDKNQLRDRYWEIQNKWNEFLNLAQCEGWNVQAHLLKTDEYRLDWRI
ncbi:hypothetical protein RP20_CCG008717 [Aedes albopictus]|nr:hypothetical protein RP20_CCG008717 [Aedes albopictus]